MIGLDHCYLLVLFYTTACVFFLSFCCCCCFLVYFLFSFGAYWLGSQRPLYQLLGSEIKGGNRAGCMTSLIGSIFCFMGSGRTWITRYYDEIGRKVREEEDNSEHVMFPLLGLFGLFALGIFMPIVGLINYIRFYIINR